MDVLDGLYRHLGTSTYWDVSGVTLTRRGHVIHRSWAEILGVRQLGGRPGYVQLIVKGHVPAQRLGEDHFSIPVNSLDDANRLATSLGWQVRGRGLSAVDLG